MSSSLFPLSHLLNNLSHLKLTTRLDVTSVTAVIRSILPRQRSIFGSQKASSRGNLPQRTGSLSKKKQYKNKVSGNQHAPPTPLLPPPPKKICSSRKPDLTEAPFLPLAIQAIETNVVIDPLSMMIARLFGKRFLNPLLFPWCADSSDHVVP